MAESGQSDRILRKELGHIGHPVPSGQSDRMPLATDIALTISRQPNGMGIPYAKAEEIGRIIAHRIFDLEAAAPPEPPLDVDDTQHCVGCDSSLCDGIVFATEQTDG